MYIDPSSYVPRSNADISVRLSDAESVIVCLAKKLEDCTEIVDDGMSAKYNADAIKKVLDENQIASVGRFTNNEYPSEIFNDYENNTADGKYSHAEGQETKADGDISHAEGKSVVASGECSHAEGLQTTAAGNYSHAEGLGSTAGGNYSHAEGMSTSAAADYSHAEGHTTVASAPNSHAEGEGSFAEGFASHAEGQSSKASGIVSHAEGNNTKAYGAYSHTEGMGTRTGTNGGSDGAHAHAEGWNTAATGNSAHSEGNSSLASGNYSHAEGQNSVSDGLYSHAEGKSTSASGEGSHAQGISCIASGYTAHAEGGWAKASGDYSHAEGQNTEASGSSSHAQGSDTKAQGRCSDASGEGTVAVNDSSTVIGRYNEYEKDGAAIPYAFAIGNGTYRSRSNAMTVDWDGNLRISGELYKNDSLIDFSEYTTEQYVEEAIDELTMTALPGAHINETGTPAVTAVKDGRTTAFTFDYLKGEKGDQGVQGIQGEKGDKGDNATTTAAATHTENGLMSASDKAKLDDIDASLYAQRDELPFVSKTGNYITANETKDGNAAVTGWVKNLIPYPYHNGSHRVHNGITYNCDENGIVTIEAGTSTGVSAYFYFVDDLPGKFKIGDTVTLSRNGIPDGCGIYIAYKTGGFVRIHSSKPSVVFTIPDDATRLEVYLRIPASTTFNESVAVPPPMLELDSTAHPYVPYNGYDITSCGRNLIPYPYYNFNEDITVLGITYKNNGDGSVTISGTNTSSDNAGIFLISPTSLNIPKGSKLTLSLDHYDGDKFFVMFSERNSSGVLQAGASAAYGATTFYVSTDAPIQRIALAVKHNVDLGESPITIYPMLELGSTAHNYEPYRSSTITVAADTPTPVYGLKTFDGETNIFNEYGADMSVVYSTANTGNAILDSAANADSRIAALEAAVNALEGN